MLTFAAFSNYYWLYVLLTDYYRAPLIGAYLAILRSLRIVTSEFVNWIPFPDFSKDNDVGSLLARVV